MQCWKKNAFQISWEPPPFRKKQLVSLSALRATGLLNYSQCSASLFRLAQIQVCFSAELLKLTVSGKPWLLILKLLSTVLLLPKINTCCNKLRLCVVKSFQSQIRKCHANWTACLCMLFAIPWLAKHWATRSSPSWAAARSSGWGSFVARTLVRHPEVPVAPVPTVPKKMETGPAHVWMCWQEPGALTASN